MTDPSSADVSDERPAFTAAEIDRCHESTDFAHECKVCADPSPPASTQAPASCSQAGGMGAERRMLADIRHHAKLKYAGGQFIHASARDADVRVLLAEVDRLTAALDERDRHYTARLHQAAESYATDTRRLMAERDEARDAVDVLTTTVRDQAGRLATAQAAMATAMAVQRVQTGQVEAVRGLMRAARQEADDAGPYARPGYRGVASVPVGDLDRALSGPTAGQPDRPEFTPDQLLGARHDQPDPTGPLVDFEEHSRDQR